MTILTKKNAGVLPVSAHPRYYRLPKSHSGEVAIRQLMVTQIQERKVNAAKSLISASAFLLAFQAQVCAQKADMGKAEYLSSCGACHGSDAKGKGSLADQLKVAPTDLTQLAKKNGGVFPMNAVYEKIDGRQEVEAHGPRDMPIWGYRYTPVPIVPNQAFDPKSLQPYLSSDPETLIRGRILSLIDYLYRIQEK